MTDAGGLHRTAMTSTVRKGALTNDEIAKARAWREQRMSWQAIARALGRSEPDVRAACEKRQGGF